MADFLSKLMKDEADEPRAPIALTVAGSDSGGGAGIQADLKTFGALGVHGTSVLTLVTAQNTRGVQDVHLLPEPVVRAQFAAVYGDLRPAAAKTGALGSEALITLVAELFADHPVARRVVDPVMVSKHGDPLLPEGAQRVLRDRLLPGALLLTPNQHEAEALTGRAVTSLGSMKEAARALFDFGAQNVLVKGAQLDDKIARDILFDGTGFVEFGADRVDSNRVHGSGCAHSAAITARLARGDKLLDAIAFAREFISGAIARAPLVGHGISPVQPLFDSSE